MMAQRKYYQAIGIINIVLIVSLSNIPVWAAETNWVDNNGGSENGEWRKNAKDSRQCGRKRVHRNTPDEKLKMLDIILIDPSKDIPLIPGQKLRTSETQRIGIPYTIQRLTERAYWVESDFYSSTFLVGDEGVMLIDPLPGDRGRNVLAAIKEVTDFPVTTLVYTHSQYDHIGGAKIFVTEAAEKGVPLEIVTTSAAEEEIRRYGNLVPLATKKPLRVPKDSFCFEDQKIVVRTPPSGHSIDNSLILLVDEKVVHSIDRDYHEI